LGLIEPTLSATSLNIHGVKPFAVSHLPQRQALADPLGGLAPPTPPEIHPQQWRGA